jgi:small conductance mechanosensitive channel
MNPAWILITRLIPETERLLDIGLRIGIAIVLGFLIQQVLFVVVRRIEVWIERMGHHSAMAKKRSKTIGQIFRSLVTVMVVSGVVLYALEVFGWDVRPLLATAGIAGVALGFGAQTLVRDVIAGIFIIAEDQFGVGDLIEINGKAATVEALTVRCATLRDFNGFLHFVPNGEMKIVVNRSRGWNRLAVDVPIAHDEDLDRALDICRGAAVAMSAEPAWRERLLDDIQVWGVDSLSPTEMLIRLVVRAEPGPDVHDAARELRRRLHVALAESDIRLVGQREILIAPSDAAAARRPGPSPDVRAS